MTLNEVVRELETICGWEVPIKYAPRRVGDVMHSMADIGAARERLGYAASVSFADGLKQTVAWYREHPAAFQRRLPLRLRHRGIALGHEGMLFQFRSRRVVSASSLSISGPAAAAPPVRSWFLMPVLTPAGGRGYMPTGRDRP